MENPCPVLLFDGDCGLCVRCVQFLLKIDRRKHLHFAPLQGEIAQAYLREQGLPMADFDSAIFLEDWSRRHEIAPTFRTDALLTALSKVGGLWKMVSGVRFVPRAWRDRIYLWVAKRRRKMFGPVNFTDRIEGEQADRFLF